MMQVVIKIFFLFFKQLTGVNDKMAEYTNAPGTASLNAALMHTLQRHRDILQVWLFFFLLLSDLFLHAK